MEENINNIKNLLKNVAKINEDFDKHPDKNEEKFNVFSVMAMEHDEVNTHSAIIGELLNPNGSHGYKDDFLKLFVKEIKKTFISNGEETQINTLRDFDTLVKDKICERTVSLKINWEKLTGGRIDLILEDHKQILIIENKLYAIDQPLQLIRYDNYANTREKDYHILYLTLNGKQLEREEKLDGEIRGYNFIHTEISEYNKFKEEKSNKHSCLYYPISFEVEIKNWIEKCIEIIDMQLNPLLKTTLKQYLVLIKKITFKTMNEEKKEKIVKTILERPNSELESSNSDNVRSAFEIIASTRNLKRNLYNKFIDKLKAKEGIEESYGTEVIDIFDDDKYCGLYVNFKNYKNIIGVFFGSKNDNAPFAEDVFIGMRKVKNLDNLVEKLILLGFESDDNWIWKRPEYSNWAETPEIWEEVAKGVKGKAYTQIINIINEIINKI